MHCKQATHRGVDGYLNDLLAMLLQQGSSSNT